MKRQQKINIGDITLLIGSTIFSVFLCLVVVEVTMSKKYFVWPPNLENTFYPSKEMSGVADSAKFRISQLGFRAEEKPTGSVFKVLVLGGSSTECLYLDQTKTWPDLLEKKLKGQVGIPVWVANAGKSGLMSAHHVFQLGKLLKQEKFDLILVMMGVNDFQRRLCLCERKNSWWRRHLQKGRIPEEAFAFSPGLWAKFSYRLKNIFYPSAGGGRLRPKGIVQDTTGEYIKTLREQRRNADVFLNDLPDLKKDLSLYEKNVSEMVAIARRNGVRIIFLTQPTIWRGDLSIELENSLWFGFTCRNKDEEWPHVYYSTKVLAEGMVKYNNILVNKARDLRVELIDAAKTLPKDQTVFYDDCHFNESGASKLANLIAEYLMVNKELDLN